MLPALRGQGGGAGAPVLQLNYKTLRPSTDWTGNRSWAVTVCFSVSGCRSGFRSWITITNILLTFYSWMLLQSARISVNYPAFWEDLLFSFLLFPHKRCDLFGKRRVGSLEWRPVSHLVSGSARNRNTDRFLQSDTCWLTLQEHISFLYAVFLLLFWGVSSLWTTFWDLKCFFCARCGSFSLLRSLWLRKLPEISRASARLQAATRRVCRVPLNITQ